MAEAASLLAGKHDYRLFCERPAEQPSTLVVVESAEVKTAGALILVRLTASHFLWKMVRRVVGTLVQVGAGELDLKSFEALLDAKPPKSGKGLPAEWTAPPSGLFLERVLYPGDPPLRPSSRRYRCRAILDFRFWIEETQNQMSLLYTAHVPAGDGPFPSIIALHGWGASAHDLLGLAPVLHGGRALVLCPEGPVAVPLAAASMATAGSRCARDSPPTSRPSGARPTSCATSSARLWCGIRSTRRGSSSPASARAA